MRPHMGRYIIGTCRTMCPEDEMKLREKERLLHILEVVPGMEKKKNPKVDPERAVKEFSRSAAGRTLTNESWLRPPEVLMKTIYYLLDDVIRNTSVSWIVKYNFIMDRLRAIRQDMIIQNVSGPYCLSILQPTVRFYAYSAYKLCDQELNVFNPYLNSKHLHECLNSLLIVYDRNEYIRLSKSESSHVEQLNELRPYFEALYVILNIGNESTLHRALNLSNTWRTPLLQTAILIALSYMNHNFVRVCRYMKKLPPLLAAISALHLPAIRRETLQTRSVAYSCKNLSFPLTTLRDLLLYDTDEDIISDCKLFNIKVDKTSIYFDKKSFNNQARVPYRKEYFVEDQLSTLDEHNLLLFIDDINEILSSKVATKVKDRI